MKIALFMKRGKPMSAEVIAQLKKRAAHIAVYEGAATDTFPSQILRDEPPDVLISYLSPWIVPERVLKRTKLWNINFHPGPPEYPGIGCFNFAIYNREKTYGVTAHVMEEKVDRGRIVGVKRFLLLESDSVYSLSVKSYEYLFALFVEILDYATLRHELPGCNEAWKRKPYTRRELEALCTVHPDMPPEEVIRRIRATTYPNKPGPYVELYGHKFEYNAKR